MPMALTTSVSLIDYRLNSRDLTIITGKYLERKVNISDFLKQERLLQKAFEHNLAVFQKSVKFFKNSFCGKQFIFPLVSRENRYS